MAINEPNCLPDGSIQDSIKVNVPGNINVKTEVILPKDTYMIQWLGHGTIAVTSQDCVSANTFLQWNNVQGQFFAVGPDNDRVILSHNIAFTGYLICYKIKPINNKVKEY
jgi:hypothetical protein